MTATTTHAGAIDGASVADSSSDRSDRLAVLLASHDANRSDESSWANVLLAVAATTLTYMAGSLVFMSDLPPWAVLFLPAVAVSFLAYLVQLLEVAVTRREELEAVERELQSFGPAGDRDRLRIPSFMLNTRYIWIWDEADLAHKVLVGFAWLAIVTTTVGYMAMILTEAMGRSVNPVALLVALVTYAAVLLFEGWLVKRLITGSR